VVSATPANKSGGGALKIVLIVFLVLGFFAILAGAGIWYAAHRIKQAVIARAHTYQERLITGDTSGIHVCELLPKETIAHLLAVPIERADGEGHECRYYGPPGLSARLNKEEMAHVTTQPNKSLSGNGVTPEQVANAVSDFAANMSHAAGLNTSTEAEQPLLIVIIQNDGKAQMTALSATKTLMSKFQGSGSEIPNLGDRAIRLGNLGLNVLKGDTIIRIVPGPVPNANDKSILVAREVLPRL
jgi:hypothetical protein